MSELTNKILLGAAAGCLAASVFFIGSMSWASLQIIALWLIITRNNFIARKEIASLKFEIWTLKMKPKQ